jgi:hypothetical protein
MQLSQKVQSLASMYGIAVPPMIIDNDKQLAKNLCWVCNE